MAQTDETNKALTPDELREKADALIETGRQVLVEAEKMEPGEARTHLEDTVMNIVEKISQNEISEDLLAEAGTDYRAGVDRFNELLEAQGLATSVDVRTDAIADYEARFPDGDTRMADEISDDARRAQEQEDAELDAAFEEMRQMHLDELELRANSGELHIPVVTGDGEQLEMTEGQIREAASRDPDLRLESPDDEADLEPTDENIAALREYHEQHRRDNEIDYDAAGDPDYLGAQAEAQFNRTEEQQSWEDRQADLLRQQQEAVAAGREAKARGERVIYVHGRPYVDPGNEHEPGADANAATLQRIESSSTDMMMSLVDRMKDDITFVRENIRELPARDRGPVTDAFRQVVTEAAAQVEQDQQAERRHEAGSDLEL